MERRSNAGDMPASVERSPTREKDGAPFAGVGRRQVSRPLAPGGSILHVLAPPSRFGNLDNDHYRPSKAR
ncbi:MAG: hypothetical protein QN168_06345 [Armatimonadota bacterium]|nr:hypothetical protein [Armatimonadota bacterium]